MRYMKNLLVGLIVIILIGLVGFFGYQLYLNSLGQPAEEQFNTSGQAKAVENESDLWPTWHDEAAGIMLSYPPEVAIEGVANDSLFLKTDVKALSDMPEYAPLGQGTDTALPNREALAHAEFGSSAGFSLPVSEHVRMLDGSLYAQDYVTLSRFEVCSVVFERTFYFFNNDHQITLSLIGPKTAIMDQNPEYFTTDEANCSNEKIWNFDKQDDFYTALKEGTLGGAAQEWYDTATKIADTIRTY